jgi:phosphoglycolate phosphatase
MILFERNLDAVLFDLDGTLIDSAPDLVAAMQRLCDEQGVQFREASAVAAVVSKGGRAMLRRAFPQADDGRLDTLLPRFLDLYAQSLALHTRPYPDVENLLRAIEARGARWGIVTNKPGWLARPLVERLGWDTRCSALVSGDCLPVKKPDPAPVLRACEIAALAPARCAYVGDDLRDIEAGRGAGMLTVAAAWGYLDGEDPHTWGADLVAPDAAMLMAALRLVA